MSWLPPITHTYGKFRQLESDENPLKDSTELFWLFYSGTLSPENFVENINGWKERAPDAAGFFIPEQKAFMLKAYENPDEATQILVDKLDLLIEKKRVPYIPDEPDPLIALYIHLHLEATRLFRLLKAQAYSEKTRESLDNAFASFRRAKEILASDLPQSLEPEYMVSFEIIGSFLYLKSFLVNKNDGEYESALVYFNEAMQLLHSAQAIINANKRHVLDSRLDVPYSKTFTSDVIKDVLKTDIIPPQTIVDCFESIKIGGEISDTKNLAAICESLINISEELWKPDDKPQYISLEYLEPVPENNTKRIIDSNGYPWESISDFWLYSLSWVEAQLNPSEFHKILQRKDDLASEQRLKNYFFGEELWEKLPERARRSLISADKDWFGGTDIRIESILSQLNIATEEILFYGLWLKIEEWGRTMNNSVALVKEIQNTKKQLSTKKGRSQLRVLADLCKKPLVEEFLKVKRIEQGERNWCSKSLPGRIHALQDQRNKAEHESGKNWTRGELGKYYNEFIGIGEVGILPRLGKLLFLSLV